jgi:ABC-type glutathione transport system ATPase component
VDEVVLRASALTRRYRLPRESLFQKRQELLAVHDVDLAVRRGEAIGVVGESGSGKSTLARLMCGLDQADEGQVLFNGADVGKMSKAELLDFRRHVQVVFQDPGASLDPRMRIEDSIAEPLRSLGTDGDISRRVDEVLESVGMPHGARRRFPHEFSGGQRQRIAIARALAPKPTVLIADEPVSALDMSVQAQVLNVLMDLRDEFGIGILFITHDLAVTYVLCDRVAVMHRGRVVESGLADDVLFNTEQEYTRALMDAVPRVSTDGRRHQPVVPSHDQRSAS